MPPGIIYESARIFAIAEASAGDDKALAASAAKRADQLITGLRATGVFRDPRVAEMFKNDPDFAAVRARLDKVDPSAPAGKP